MNSLTMSAKNIDGSARVSDMKSRMREETLLSEIKDEVRTSLISSGKNHMSSMGINHEEKELSIIIMTDRDDKNKS